MMRDKSFQFEKHRHSSDQPWTYKMLDQRQRKIAQELLEGRRERGVILLSEVSPVITFGRRTDRSDILFSEEMLFSKGIGLFATDRGGLATYHGPGQWVLFAVEKLEVLTGDPRGVKRAVCALLEIALEVARNYDSRAEIRQGAELGVWTSRGKIAAVGIHVKDDILLHGLSFNGYRTETSFFGLRPCGLDLPVSFALSEGLEAKSREEAFERVGQELAKAAFERFVPLDEG